MTMDNIGLDRLIDGVLDTYERIWLAVRVGIIHLKQGVGWVDETLVALSRICPRCAARPGRWQSCCWRWTAL